MGLRQAAIRIIGERNRGRLGYWLRHDPPDMWGGPFNGQVARAQMFHDILEDCPVQAIVETGTFRGTTTERFAATGLPVYTVEARPRNAAYARLRLRRFRNVSVQEGDSRAFLKRLASDPAVPSERVFFYLDAHWGQDLPLAEEMDLIFTHWARAVVMVDDFHVPDTAYGFDDYGPGKALTLDYLAPVLERHGGQVFFPATDAADETGARRGSVVICTDSDVAATLASVPSLRSA